MKKFIVTVKFDLSSEKVVNCIMNNFDFDKMSNDGTIEMIYTRGNKNSTEQSAIKGMKKRLNFFESFKNGFTIIGAKEITE